MNPRAQSPPLSHWATEPHTSIICIITIDFFFLKIIKDVLSSPAVILNFTWIQIQFLQYSRRRETIDWIVTNWKSKLTPEGRRRNLILSRILFAVKWQKRHWKWNTTDIDRCEAEILKRHDPIHIFFRDERPRRNRKRKLICIKGLKNRKEYKGRDVRLLYIISG